MGMMDRIENEYNYYHRTHIYLTSTLSLVINRPHKDTQMFNANYHKNINAIKQKAKKDKKLYKKYL